MINISEKYVTSAGLALVSFTLTISDALAAGCVNVPSCSELGYTDTSCTGGKALKCPFDQTKLFCVGQTSTPVTPKAEPDPVVQPTPSCPVTEKSAAKKAGYSLTAEEKDSFLKSVPTGCYRGCEAWFNPDEETKCTLYKCSDYKLETIKFEKVTPIDCSNGGKYCGGKKFKYDYEAAANKYVDGKGSGWLRPTDGQLSFNDGIYNMGWKALDRSGVIFPAEENERGGQGPSFHMGQYMWGGRAAYNEPVGENLLDYYTLIFVHEKILEVGSKKDKCNL